MDFVLDIFDPALPRNQRFPAGPNRQVPSITDSVSLCITVGEEIISRIDERKDVHGNANSAWQSGDGHARPDAYCSALGHWEQADGSKGWIALHQEIDRLPPPVRRGQQRADPGRWREEVERQEDEKVQNHSIICWSDGMRWEDPAANAQAQSSIAERDTDSRSGCQAIAEAEIDLWSFLWVGKGEATSNGFEFGRGTQPSKAASEH